MCESYKLIGVVDENLFTSQDDKIKTIRLINVLNDESNYSFEIVTESLNDEHELVNSLIGKKISIEVKVID